MVADRRKLKVTYPTQQQLQAWWIWHKMKTVPFHECDDPEQVNRWLSEFRVKGFAKIHHLLYANYNDYRLEFVNPHYVSI